MSDLLKERTDASILRDQCVRRLAIADAIGEVVAQVRYDDEDTEIDCEHNDAITQVVEALVALLERRDGE